MSTDLLLDLCNTAIFTAILFVKLTGVKHELWPNYPASDGFIVGSLGGALLIVTTLLLFRRDRRYLAFILVNFVVSFILLADLVYNRYYSDVTSVILLRQARLAGEVKSSVIALLRPSDIAFFIDIILMVPILFVSKARGRRSMQHMSSWRYRLAAMLVLSTVGYQLCASSIQSLEAVTPGMLKTFYDKKYIMGKIGGVSYHAVDAYRFAYKRLTTGDISADDRTLVKQWFSERMTGQVSSGRYQATPRYTAVMQGKNLIMVQLEAFQSFVLNRTINGQEITPNLNRLAKSSLVFDNLYYQTALGNTSDAEFLANTSMLPAQEGAAYYEYAANTFQSLPQALKEAGYQTAVMHANRPGFWNRLSMYRSMGFDTYESNQNFTIDETYILGLTDHSFYRQAVEKLKQYRQPFYSFLVSLSSHFPFNDPNIPLDDLLDLGEFEGTFMGDYLESIHYADQAIGILISELKTAGLWDNSAVVFYGDHGAIPYEKRDELARLILGRDEMSQLEWFQAQRVVGMMHFPGERIKGIRAQAAGQIDLYPTLANLFGLTPKYALGSDLLNSSRGFVVFRNGMWASDNAMYFNHTHKILELSTGGELSAELFAWEIEKAQDSIRVSDLTLDHNLIKYFESRTGD